MFLFCNEDKKKKERLNSVLKTTHNLIKKNDINRGITFLATDNKNCVLIDVGDNGVCGGSYIPNRKLRLLFMTVSFPQIFCTIQQVDNSCKHISVFDM